MDIQIKRDPGALDKSHVSETLNFTSVKSGPGACHQCCVAGLINRFIVAYQDQFRKGGRILNTTTNENHFCE